MIEQILKIIVTSIIVVTASEAAKRSTIAGALLASLPLTSLLAMTWLYVDTHDTERVAAFANGIFWLLLPSLTMLLVLPLLLRNGFDFWFSLALSIILTAVSYAVIVKLLQGLGIHF
jgi:hypothetical protein